MICWKSDKIRPGESQHEAGVRLRDEMLRALCAIPSPSVIAELGQKPRLADRPEISFSVSHSGSVVICAISFPGTARMDGLRVICGSSDAPEVGADVERVRDVSEAPRLRRIARRFFPEGEAARLDALPDADCPRAFCEIWTAMESYVKRTGEGFARGFAPVDLTHVRRITDSVESDGKTYIISVTF